MVLIYCDAIIAKFHIVSHNRESWNQISLFDLILILSLPAVYEMIIVSFV